MNFKDFLVEVVLLPYNVVNTAFWMDDDPDELWVKARKEWIPEGVWEKTRKIEVSQRKFSCLMGTGIILFLLGMVLL